MTFLTGAMQMHPPAISSRQASWSSLGSRQVAVGQAQACVLKGLLFIATRNPRALISGAGVLHSAAQVPEILEVHFEDSQVCSSTEWSFGILNTRDFAIPQSRPRLYVIAIARECLKGSFGLPKPRTSMPKLQSFLECSVRGDKGDPDHPKPETLRKYIARFRGRRLVQLRLRLLRAILEAAGDPDRDFLRQAEEGLPLGKLLDVGSSPQFQSVRPGVFVRVWTKTRLSGRGSMCQA